LGRRPGGGSASCLRNEKNRIVAETARPARLLGDFARTLAQRFREQRSFLGKGQGADKARPAISLRAEFLQKLCDAIAVCGVRSRVTRRLEAGSSPESSDRET